MAAGATRGHFWRGVIAIACAAVMCFARPGESRTVSQSRPYDHEGLAKQVLEKHIRPGYRRLAEAMDTLAARVDYLCEAPGRTRLDFARDAFKDAALAWAAVEHIRFGPVTEANRYERMAFWPDPKGIGRKQVARLLRQRDKSTLDVTTLSQKSVALQGLTALEIVLFGKAGSALARAAPDEDFRCRYGLAIARNLQRISREVRGGWAPSGGFVRTWLTPGAGNPVYRKRSEVTLEIVKAYSYGLELIREVKLTGPLGMRDPDQRPSRPQYALSGFAIPVIGASLNAVTDLFHKGGLAERLAVYFPDMAELIDTELGTVAALAGEITNAGANAFEDEETRDALISMGFPLKNARLTGSDALTAAAGLGIGFNAGDGD